jgi:hypothetical protein
MHRLEAIMKPVILVTGDVVLDHNLYAGQRLASDSSAACGMRHTARPGGAMLTYGLLKALARIPPGPDKKMSGFSDDDLAFGLKEVTEDSMKDWPKHLKMGAVWDQFEGPQKDEPVWQLARNLGYGPREEKPYPAAPAPGLADMRPRVIVIDDGGLGFRLQTASMCWPGVFLEDDKREAPQWVILKMSSPLGRGDLWRLLADRWSDRLIIIVAADDIRRENVRITRGLSWESTVDDFLEELQSNPSIGRLKACRHLVITLRGDAALWLNGLGKAEQQCRLVFDRERGEGEWESGIGGGRAFGYLSAVTAAVTWHLKDADTGDSCNLVPALRAGLSAARVLGEYGHGPVKSTEEPGFPFTRAAQEICNPKHAYSSTEVQCSASACGGGADMPASSSGAAPVPPAPQWTILRQNAHSEAFPGPLFGPARRIALLGPAALANVPCARFGKLLTMDRREIDALRSLRQLMLAYDNSGSQKQPLSLAAFGPPGSGKSFGLKQVAEGVFGEKNPILEFNLSQFKGPEDLIGAYHQVRDYALAGKTPVVFWDEFDSRNYFWLQYLLAPMQDGTFQEGQLTHSIGKSVFVFAGGTSRNFAHFGPPSEPHEDDSDAERKARVHFAVLKGPDFKSRLSGYLNVLGPNPRQTYNAQRARAGHDPWEDDKDDVDFPVRRAILLRSMLGFVKEKENDPLEIDRGLLTALLRIGRYRHGTRSLEKLILQTRDRGGLPLLRAYLPCDELVALYVDDANYFVDLTRCWHRFQEQAERLAPLIHQDWRGHLSDEERAKGSPNDVSYDKLGLEAREANIAAAMRMPEILALAGLMLVEGQAGKNEEAPVAARLKKHLDILAEAEHIGWVDQKRMEGWRYGPAPQNRRALTHPLLVPYAELQEDQKDKDRRAITNYPTYARGAGFKIVPDETRKRSTELPQPKP